MSSSSNQQPSAHTPFPAPGSLDCPVDQTVEGDQTSYTPLLPKGSEMATSLGQNNQSADIDAIGSQCQLASCHQLDFLPFRCESCRSVFCLEHRSESSHSCPQAGTWARRRVERSHTPQSQGPSKTAVRKADAARRLLERDALPTECQADRCRERINVGLKQGVHCEACTMHYCLHHRLPEEHACAPPRSVQEARAKAEKKAVLDRFRTWSLARTTKMLKPGDGQRRKGGQQAARAKLLADLRRDAKGDPKVPLEKRIYLIVEAEALPREGQVGDYHTASVPCRKLFVNGDWKIGRALDFAARELGLENRNNLGGGEEERLRVFHVQGGRILQFSEAVSPGVAVGDTLVLLRGIGGVEGV